MFPVVKLLFPLFQAELRLMITPELITCRHVDLSKLGLGNKVISDSKQFPFITSAWHLMCLFTYCSPDTYRSSDCYRAQPPINTQILLRLSENSFFCNIKSSSGLNNFSSAQMNAPRNYLFFYLCLISSYVIIWQWFISQLGLFFLLVRNFSDAVP